MSVMVNHNVKNGISADTHFDEIKEVTRTCKVKEIMIKWVYIQEKLF